MKTMIPPQVTCSPNTKNQVSRWVRGILQKAGTLSATESLHFQTAYSCIRFLETAESITAIGVCRADGRGTPLGNLEAGLIPIVYDVLRDLSEIPAQHASVRWYNNNEVQIGVIGFYHEDEERPGANPIRATVIMCRTVAGELELIINLERVAPGCQHTHPCRGLHHTHRVHAGLHDAHEEILELQAAV